MAGRMDLVDSTFIYLIKRQPDGANPLISAGPLIPINGIRNPAYRLIKKIFILPAGALAVMGEATFMFRIFNPTAGGEPLKTLVRISTPLKMNNARSFTQITKHYILLRLIGLAM